MRAVLVTLMCVGVGAFLAGNLGCQNETTKTASGKSDHSHEGDDHEHGDHEHGDDGHSHKEGDHADGHSHELGPKGGHIFSFADGKGAGEWAHADSEEKVTVYLLDETKKELKPVAFTKVYIVRKSGDKVKEFELTPVDATDGKAAAFERVDKALLAAMNLGVELVVETEDGKMTAEIEPHHH